MRARVNIYLVADWLDVEKLTEKLVEKFLKIFSFRRVRRNLEYFVGYTARSYSQLVL